MISKNLVTGGVLLERDDTMSHFHRPVVGQDVSSVFVDRFSWLSLTDDVL